MQLIDIENIVLGNIGRYGVTDSGTLTLLEANVNLAIREIASGAVVPAIMKTQTIVTADRSTTLNPAYNLDTDFDVEVMVRYLDANGTEWDLIKTFSQPLRTKLGGGLRSTGRPDIYRIFGTVSGHVQLLCYPITAYANESIFVDYVPILAALAADSDENVVTVKYPQIVIEIATGWSFINIISDMAKGSPWLTSGRGQIRKLQAREQSGPSINEEPLPPSRLVNQRRSRRTQ